MSGCTCTITEREESDQLGCGEHVGTRREKRCCKERATDPSGSSPFSSLITFRTSAPSLPNDPPSCVLSSSAS